MATPVVESRAVSLASIRVPQNVRTPGLVHAAADPPNAGRLVTAEWWLLEVLAELELEAAVLSAGWLHRTKG